MTSVRQRHLPRHREPELERDITRSPSLGYEAPEETGLVRCLAHGFPSPLVRWHFHEEYELHLITETSGKAFVGDWIGPFQPGHLVLCGPRLPHNWISLDVPEGGAAGRDRVIQFRHEPIERAAARDSRAARGACSCSSARATASSSSASRNARWRTGMRVKAARGLRRFAAVLRLPGRPRRSAPTTACSPTCRCRARKATPRSTRSTSSSTASPPTWPSRSSMADIAAELGMSESRFSRFFKRSTGNSFTDFVNRVRINSACHLLMQTDHYVTDICYQVGFNNVANFNRRFLEIKGMTPTEFRRQSDQPLRQRRLRIGSCTSDSISAPPS